MAASAALRRAKRMLQRRLGKHSWYSGVGIVPADGKLGLRVNASDTPSAGLVPKTYYGFSVEVVVIRSYQPRSGG